MALKMSIIVIKLKSYLRDYRHEKLFRHTTLYYTHDQGEGFCVKFVIRASINNRRALREIDYIS